MHGTSRRRGPQRINQSSQEEAGAPPVEIPPPLQGCASERASVAERETRARRLERKDAEPGREGASGRARRARAGEPEREHLGEVEGATERRKGRGRRERLRRAGRKWARARRQRLGGDAREQGQQSPLRVAQREGGLGVGGPPARAAEEGEDEAAAAAASAAACFPRPASTEAG